MIEITGNIFDIKDADAICVTTNGVVKDNGELIMGKGIALEFKNRWPQLPKFLGNHIKAYGNHVYAYDPKTNGLAIAGLNRPHLVSLPTKHNWKDKSDINLIYQSVEELVDKANHFGWKKVVLPRPGCGNGGLDWEKEVKPAIQDILDDRFYIITPGIDFKKLSAGIKESRAKAIEEGKLLTIGGTGHRPTKLFDEGDPYSFENFTLLVRFIEARLDDLMGYYERPIDRVITGMALGFDQALAVAAVNRKIYVLAAIPCKGQEARWPQASQEMYHKILARCNEKVILSEFYTNRCMFERDEWMVNKSSAMIALFNGSSGGTGHTVEYALKMGVPIHNFWDDWEDYLDNLR